MCIKEMFIRMVKEAKYDDKYDKSEESEARRNIRGEVSQDG